jgi:peptidoglycan/LPS O-acetylase OafA/YrhL
MGLPTPSIGEILGKHRGHGPGFEHLRIGLAISILIWHSFGLSYGFDWTLTISSPTFALVSFLLPMFFALSGFLVMGSAIRLNDLRTFLTFRVLRILPALMTEIFLSALVLGPLLTVLPLMEYFTSPTLYEYFGSLIGRVRFVLPGLFLNNPFPGLVNGALWTVGPEILCYLLISLTIVSGAIHRKKAFIGIVLTYTGLCLLSDILLPLPLEERLPTKAIVLGFLVGNLIFIFREKLPYSLELAVASLIASIGFIVAAKQYPTLHFLIYPAVFFMAYLTVFIGLTRLPKMPFFDRGDYSYGIYIFGFPIQQTVSHFFPDQRFWWFNFAASLPATLLFAVASWHFVEKPVLNFRKKFAGGQPRADNQKPICSLMTVAIVMALLLYSAYVAREAHIFPIGDMARHLLGKPPLNEKNDQPTI